MRLSRLAVLGVSLAGCGALTPSLVPVPRLAPDLTPPRDGSSAVVTSRTAGRGDVRGQVVDLRTGVALAGVRVTATGADGTAAEATTDAAGAFRLGRLSGVAALRADEACHAPLDARPGVGADTTATILVLLMPTDCGAGERQ